jgi:hypothetical protein
MYCLKPPRLLKNVLILVVIHFIVHCIIMNKLILLDDAYTHTHTHDDTNLTNVVEMNIFILQVNKNIRVKERKDWQNNK